METFTVAMLGCGGVGKTTLLRKLLTNEFVPFYNPTVGMQMSQILCDFTSNVVVQDYNVQFNVLEFAGQEREDITAFLSQVDAVIVMFGVDNRISFKNAKRHIAKVRNTCGNVPIVVVANKADTQSHKIHPNDIVQLDLPCFYTSAKTGANIDMPFLHLARELIENTI